MTKWLVTGCPRSGTTYTAHVLQASGLDVEHEKPGADGTVDWNPARYGDPRDYDQIVHLVREPLDCIASMHVIYHANHEFKDYGAPVHRGALYCCMWLWVWHNRHCSNLTSTRLRVEDMATRGSEVFGQPLKASSVSKKTNTKRHSVALSGMYPKQALTWGALYSEAPVTAYRVNDLAKEYGYADS